MSSGTTSVNTSNYTIQQVGSTLVFQYNGANVATLSSTGTFNVVNLAASANVTATNTVSAANVTAIP
jgi:hypothetical protein